MAITKPTGSPSRYNPNTRPKNPPTNAPTIPSIVVTMNPPGSRPGMRSFPMIPTTKPKKIHPRMLMARSPFYPEYAPAILSLTMYAISLPSPKPNSLPTHQDQNTGSDSKQSQYNTDGWNWDADHLQQACHDKPYSQQEHSQVFCQIHVVHLLLCEVRFVIPSYHKPRCSTARGRVVPNVFYDPRLLVVQFV